MAEADATRACVVCGVLFPRKGKTLSCSDACKRVRYERVSKAGAIRAGRTKGPQQLQCKRCGCGFVGVASKVYCTDKCKDAARRADPIDSERRRTRWQRMGKDQRARRNTAKRENRKRNKRDRSGEWAKRRAKMGPPLPPKKDWVALALKGIADICATSTRREWAIRVRVGRADAIKVRKPAVARGQSDYTKKLKSNPVAYIAAIGRWRAKTLKRKTGKTMIDDGTASAVAVSLMRTKSCLYCACGLTDDSRTIDHMDPLSKGGTHSASNLCACCWSCNNKKGSKRFVQFVAGLSDEHGRRVIAYYERLNRFVQQGSLSFGMAA